MHPADESQASPCLYSIQVVPGKGLGFVAASRIEKGTRILAEAPIVQCPRQGTASDKTYRKVNHSILKQLSALSVEDREAFYALHNAWRTEHDDYKESGIVWTNAMPLGASSKDGGVFLEASRLNHACRPNAQATWIDAFGKMIIHATRDIEKDEEITITYVDPLLARAARQRQLDECFRIACRCALCSLPPAGQRESDARLEELQRLQKSVDDSSRSMSSPLQALRDVRRMLQLLQQEKIVDSHVSNTNYDAFQILNFHGDLARAKVFATRAYQAQLTVLGSDSPDVQRVERLSQDPSRHPSSGLSKMWSTKLEDVPDTLDEEQFEAWLWQTESRGAPIRTPPKGGFAAVSTFPSFEALPEDHVLDPDYFDLGDNGRTFVPSKHWCFLGEIVNVECFTRLRLVVKDRNGTKAVVAFYTDDDGVSFATRCQVGHTVAIMYAQMHYFLDGSSGMRLEDPRYVTILPASMKKLFRLSDGIQRFTSLENGLSLCHGCEQRRATKKCAKCALFSYCNKDCQVTGWKEKGHKGGCKLLQDPDLETLLKLDAVATFEGLSLFD